MYIPSHFAETSRSVLFDVIERYPLATLVTEGDDGIAATHIPLVLDREGSGALRGHVPRANPVWRSCHGSAPALAVFHGPQAYVSPSWYPSKAEHGKVVPTWDYVSVQVRGLPRVIEDEAWIHAQVTALTERQESRFDQPWKVGDAPAEFTASLVGTLVGIEIAIESIAGNFKLSQNRSAEDRRGVVRGLAAQNDAGAQALAELVLAGLQRAGQ